eukprot:185207-Pleurochrysis_carterae.AAC.1
MVGPRSARSSDAKKWSRAWSLRSRMPRTVLTCSCAMPPFCNPRATPVPEAKSSTVRAICTCRGTPRA